MQKGVKFLRNALFSAYCYVTFAFLCMDSTMLKVVIDYIVEWIMPRFEYFIAVLFAV